MTTNHTQPVRYFGMLQLALLGVPLWLPGLYLHGAFALREGYRRLVVGRA